jgi:hypothetical protein
MFAKAKLSSAFRWIRIFLPFVIVYIIWIVCAMVSIPYIKVSMPDNWHSIAWFMFVFLIPFFFLPFIIGSVTTHMGWTITSKKLWLRGYDFCVTRGPGKNTKKDIIPGVAHPEHGPALPDMEVQDYGSLSQWGIEGPYDVVYPVGCISDGGMVVEIIGNPHAYDPEQLPEPIRSRYIREKIDPVTGDIIVQTIRQKKKVTLVLPALNPTTNEIIGMGFDHALVQLQQETIKNLREQNRRLSSGEGGTTIIREVDTTQPPLVPSG